MFLSCSIAGCRIGEFSLEVWPFVLAMTVVVVGLALFPGIVLWLPHVLMDYPW